DGLASYALSPLQAPAKKAVKGSGEKVEEAPLKPDAAAPFVGQVFKAVADKFVGNMSFLRVYQGTYKAEQPLVNGRTDKSARTGGLFEVQGGKTTPLADAVPGDIVAVTKVEDLHIGDTVANQPHPPKLAAPTFPMPMFGLAVEPKARGD